MPGGLPYLAASGTLKKILERITEAAQPPKFNSDFLENVLKLKGGAGRAIPPILKKLGMLSTDGVPTDLYAKFRTESGRGRAAHQALRNGFPEIFKRSDYAHTVPDNKLRDIIVEITGLNPNDKVVQAIMGTFSAVKSFVPSDLDITGEDIDIGAGFDEGQINSMGSMPGSFGAGSSSNGGIRLAYNINIVLPETSDLIILIAIFRSIKENLMQ
ncbi:DUF5343 domain-containing protein [Mesorhizobium sp. B2-6-7]|uniref:DUF5343 domain-containing protein n=1 Tax=Mesorhizobium sp. B2-6-7 TaxID=2589910 RepID=UPI00248487B5|nr:DUF5343 domain-containing protein [Mesorhizobium sp. B2-6-7]